MAILKLEPQLANNTANFTFGNVFAGNFYYANGTLYGGSGGTPGGTNTQVQYNNSGNFAGSSQFTFDSATNVLAVVGNVTANYFVGNGSQLTGLPASYADSNVATYLPTYTGVMTFDVANLHVSGGASGQYLQTDGTGNLTWATVSGGGGGGGGGTYITRKYTANGTGNTYTVTSGCGVDNVLVFVNGICQAPTDDYTITTTTLTLDGTPASGSKIHIRELPR